MQTNKIPSQHRDLKSSLLGSFSWKLGSGLAAPLVWDTEKASFSDKPDLANEQQILTTL
jgi:hypothetical protein